MSARTQAPLGRLRGDRRITWFTLVGLVLVPLTVAGVLLWGLWNPQDRLDRVTAAVVNLDEPVELDGQTVPLGRVLAGELIGGDHETNFTWELTDEDDAEAGIDDGRYATVVTIPENFSAAATSISDGPDEARQATIEIAPSDRGRLLDSALSNVVTATATDVLNRQLGEQFIGGVFVGFSDLREGVGEAAGGASELASGGAQLADGADQLASGAAELVGGTGLLASGAGELAGGTNELAGGASELAGGASGLAAGASDLAGGASELAGGTAGLVDGASELAGGASQLAGGADELAGGAGDLAAGAGGVAEGARGLADGLGGLATGADDLAVGARQSAEGSAQLAAGVEQYTGGVNAVLEQVLAGGAEASAGLVELRDAIADGTLPVPDDQTRGQLVALLDEAIGGMQSTGAELDQLRQAGDELAAGARQNAEGAAGVADGVADLAAGVHGLAGGATELAGGAEGVAGGASTLAGGASELAGGVSGLAGGAEQLHGGAAQLNDGAAQLANGAGALAGGAGTLAGGASELAGGAGELAGGAGQLSAGVSALAAQTPQLSEGAAQLADGTRQSADGARSLADGLDEAVRQIPNYDQAQRDRLAATAMESVDARGGSDELLGAAGVPLFVAVALWAGALAMFLVLAPLWRRTRTAALGTASITLRSAVPALGLGAVQGALAGLALPVALGYDLSRTTQFLALGLLAGVAFALLAQGLSALLGGLGRFISFALLVVTFAVGIVSTVPGPLRAVGDASPIGAAYSGFQAVANGVAGGGAAALLLVLWGLAGLVLTGLAVLRERRAV